MTVEEIKMMCNNVLNTSRQLDNDYMVLKEKEEDKDKELADRFNSFLNELTTNYLETGKALAKKADELTIEYRNEYWWRNVKGLCVDSSYIYSEEVMRGNLICGFSMHSKDNIGIVFARDSGWKKSTIEVWQYSGDMSPFYIDTSDNGICRSFFDHTFHTYEKPVRYNVLETLKAAPNHYSPNYNKDMFVNDLETIINYGEDMIQKLIAKMSQVILDLSVERNKAVTDRL